jgi:hypothetical protein
MYKLASFPTIDSNLLPASSIDVGICIAAAAKKFCQQCAAATPHATVLPVLTS